MKKTINSVIAVVMVCLCVLSFASCAAKEQATGLWEKATYTEDKSFGEGSKTLVVEVKAEEKQVAFTIKTDKETVGEALLEHNLIAGEESAYGLYIKQVNGITADYDTDKAYWAFYVNGEYAMSGVDTTKIDTGAKYSLEYTNG